MSRRAVERLLEDRPCHATPCHPLLRPLHSSSPSPIHSHPHKPVFPHTRSAESKTPLASSPSRTPATQPPSSLIQLGSENSIWRSAGPQGSSLQHTRSRWRASRSLAVWSLPLPGVYNVPTSLTMRTLGRLVDLGGGGDNLVRLTHRGATRRGRRSGLRRPRNFTNILSPSSRRLRPGVVDCMCALLADTTTSCEELLSGDTFQIRRMPLTSTPAAAIPHASTDDEATHGPRSWQQ